MAPGCSMEVHNMWSFYSNHILLEKSLEDVLISQLIFHLFHNDTSSHMLVMYSNISLVEISLWCQKVTSMQTGLVRQAATKILVLSKNRLEKQSRCFYYCTQQGWQMYANKKVHTWRTPADIERHRSILLCARKSHSNTKSTSRPRCFFATKWQLPSNVNKNFQTWINAYCEKESRPLLSQIYDFMNWPNAITDGLLHKSIQLCNSF